MNNDTVSSTPEVKPAVNITAADVVAWLQARRTQLQRSDATFHAYVSPVFPGGCFMTSAPHHPGSFGPDCDDVIRTFNASVKTPAQIAAQKREQAAKLLAEAAAIDTTPVVSKEAA